jgi:hypothetical protein
VDALRDNWTGDWSPIGRAALKADTSRAEIGQILESMPFTGKFCYSAREADAGSVPVSTETPQKFEPFRTNPHPPASSDDISLIFKELIDRSALADCGLSKRPQG